MDIGIDNTSLICAVKANDIEKVKLLVGEGVDVNQRGQDTFTPLHVAVHYGHAGIIYFLWENGAYLDCILGGKMHGLTPLDLAVQNNDLECVKLLLSLGAHVGPKEGGIYHPIHYAVYNNFVDVACELVQHGANINVRFDNNFFEKYPVTMDHSLWLDHDLPLYHYVILQKYHDMLDVLRFFTNGLEKTKLGKTSLMQAVEVCNIRCVQNLVTKENVNDRDSFGQPVLHFTMVNANRKASMYCKKEYALSAQRYLVLKILLKHGADVNARFPENEEHSSVIHYMIKCGFTSGVVYLLYECSDFDYNVIDVSTLHSGRIFVKSLTPDIADDRPYLNDLNNRFKEIMYCLIKRAMDLKIIGLPINEDLILKYPIHPWITLKMYNMNIDNHKNLIIENLNYMKETKVGDTNIAIWYLLTCEMNKLVKLMSIEDVRNFVPRDHKKKLFHYCSILEKRLRFAYDRKLFLNETMEQVAISFYNRLPFDCCEQIVKFL